MVAKVPELADVADVAPRILKPLRTMRNMSPPDMARQMGMSTRTYQEFENGAPALFFQRLLQFADILRVDVQAIVAAFLFRKPGLAHVFAQNKLMLIQASAIDELDQETRDALAAVDPLTILDAHTQFYLQLADVGRAQLRTGQAPRREDDDE